MATVTGVTAERVAEVEHNSIAGAAISGNDLIFTTGGDDPQTINAGRVISPAVNSWPVGSIFMNVYATNPSTLLGGGTWVRWGKGRMPISLDEANTRLDTSEEVGGAETVTLTVVQIPSHNHGGQTNIESNDHSHAGYTDSQGSHQHTGFDPAGGSNNASGSAVRYSDRQAALTGVAGAHDHNVQTYGVNANHVHAITAQGGGGSHENMPPFITVYMWKRTA